MASLFCQYVVISCHAMGGARQVNLDGWMGELTGITEI
jgi:hypothetical protein